MGAVSWGLCEAVESCSLCNPRIKLLKLSIRILTLEKGKQKVRELQAHAQRHKAGKAGWDGARTFILSLSLLRCFPINEDEALLQLTNGNPSHK